VFTVQCGSNMASLRLAEKRSKGKCCFRGMHFYAYSLAEGHRDPHVLVEFDDGLLVVPAEDLREQKDKGGGYEWEAKWMDGRFYGCEVIFEGKSVHAFIPQW